MELDNTQVELEKVVPVAGGLYGPEAGELSKTIENALTFAKEGKKVLTQRQKLIRLADRSELWWMVVGEYEADELADDGDDEKRIAKAIKSAEKKAEAVRRKRRSKGPAGNGAVSYRGKFLRPSNVVQPQLTRSAGQNTVPYTQAIGPCFACHEYGHLRSGCPSSRRVAEVLCILVIGA